MNNTQPNFISLVLTEACLDERIDNGILDIHNSEHVRVIAETMYDMCADENVVNEFVQKFMEEGKYPDRQAYNKEGWLVTFPSKEYRDRAIKKGTHSISDPTHGKGGMNLYYKRKGKQKRQTQQDPSATETPPPTQKAAPQADKTPASNVDTKTNSPEEAPSEEPLFSDVTDDNVDDGSKSTSAEKIPSEDEPTDSALPPSDGGKEAAPSDGPASAPATAPQAPAAPTPPPPPPFVELSKKFAAQKGWAGTPYGEWRDRSGTAMAVEALSGEVVPIKTNDREELKLFVEKNK